MSDTVFNIQHSRSTFIFRLEYLLSIINNDYHSTISVFTCFFTSFIFPQILPQYPADLPPTVLSPLLTDSAVGLLSQVVDPEEDQLWRSLGDCWNIPR